MTSYHPSADQVALAASIGESLASILPLSRLRESQVENAETWKALRELGVFAVTAPEVQGGSGLGALEEALIVIELGRRAASPSVFATIGAAVHRSPEPCVAAGYRRGERMIFIDEPSARHVLVRASSRAELYELGHDSQVLDEHLWSCTLRETGKLGKAVAELGGAQALRLRLLDAAALAGSARAALEMAVEYATLREQFGRAIGSFQAIKHSCANMAMAARLACDQVSFAALALDEQRPDAALQVESAFFVAASAAHESCGKNIQVHGGIGFSDEALPHHLLKRARVLIEIAGGLDAALVRVGACTASDGGADA